ncbi:MAG: hypothetical protein IJ047_05490 [Paludibacteraceae bacterium]|nr:hypothetical protein [Paludibacteraceae bacterium]
MKFDPNATSELKLLIDDEIPQYVTIEELQELLKQKAYQTTQDELILSLMSKERRVEALMPPTFTLFPYWISSHLLVQTCMQDFEAYDWAKITDVYNIPRIAEIAFIASHPYVWQPIEERPLDTIISGKIATMQFDSSRCSIKWLDKMVNERVLFLADHKPAAVQDTYLNGEGNVLKGMLLWNLIVTDGRNFIKRSLVENVPEGVDTSIRFFDTESFRENLQYIAQERSPKIAAELLQALRKDWQGIVAWKCFGIDTLKPEQVEKFRSCLFDGMEYYLQQWMTETEQQTTPQPSTACRYIDKDKLAETGVHSEEEFTRLLRQACEQDAKTLAAFLKKYYKLQYLDFHGENKKKIYEHLKQCFPGTIKYSYTNFTLYFD